MNDFFCFLEKFEQVFVVICDPHFPHTKPFIEIFSYNFKATPYTGANWNYEPLILFDRAIKYFKNISEKFAAAIASYITRRISSIKKLFYYKCR